MLLSESASLARAFGYRVAETVPAATPEERFTCISRR